MSELSDRHLAALEPTFLKALEARANGRIDAARELFADILRIEPRLAEPRMELGRIHLETGRLDDAEVEAREALRILEAGGQWSMDVPEPVMLALAWALLGAILKEQAATDEVVFGDPAVFEERIRQSRVAFARAAELDPADTISALNAAEMGDRSGEGEGEGEEQGEPEVN